MTFSLLARDPATGTLGVASASHCLGVGAVVTWAEAGIGVIATQAIPGRWYGPRGLALMQQGLPANQALAQLLDGDLDREVRQVGYLDASGAFGIHSGDRCLAASGVAISEHAAGLGNMLDSDAVLDAMLVGFEHADGDLAHRLLAGMRSADHAGGDIRGRQSAALLVVDDRRTDALWNGVVRNLRVDDHPDPLGELTRLLDLNDAFEKMSQVVFDPSGAVLGESGAQREFATAAAVLAGVDAVLDTNPDAAFWSAVLHARWGRFTEARRLLADATTRNPRLPRFVARLAGAGILTQRDAAGLTPETPGVQL
jgi:uncharacterized Ntn-hydrolase superfamily protein